MTFFVGIRHFLQQIGNGNSMCGWEHPVPVKSISMGTYDPPN